MKLTLPAFDTARVLVIGDIMLDRYWTGPTGRISPEAPVPVVKVEGNEERPGGAANVALNVAALGSQAILMGMTGTDEAAESLATNLQGIGVKCRFQQVDSHPTITKLRIVSRHQQLIRLDFEESFHEVDAAPLHQLLSQSLADCDVVIFSDYNKGALADVSAMIQTARQAGKKILVDPKGTDFDKYRGATLLTPNLGEFEAVVGACRDEDTLVERGQALRQRLELEALLVTRGEHGMTLLTEGAEPLHLPAMAQEVFDVTGAGDTVISVLGAALSAGQGFADACALANAAASVVVGKLGTSTVSQMELAQVMSGGQQVGFGVVTQAQLPPAVAAARARGEKIVMTNGCFDILHAGHVSYLEKARAQGDRLIVAVNDDASVKRLKGVGRPVNQLERRMQVLAGLAAVDWVVPFSEDTPARLIGEVLPDLLVKGGDYQPEAIAGGDAVIANGGDVRVLNFEDGLSTTDIINRLKGQ